MLYIFFHLTYSRWTSSLPSCLWSQRIFPSLPGSRLTIFLSRCKFSTLTTRQPLVEFYLLTFPRFPLRKKEHKSYFGKNRTHDFRTSRCAAYLLDHSCDERGNHKIRFGRVLHRPRDNTKLLYLYVVYLSSTSASVFRRRLPWFGASMEVHSGVPRGLHSKYASIYLVQKNANHISCAACLELVQVQAQTIISQKRNMSLLWMPGGHVALASAVQDGSIV